MLQNEHDKLGVVTEEIGYADGATVVCHVPLGGVIVKANVTILEAYNGTAPTVKLGSEVTADKLITKTASAVGGGDSANVYVATASEKQVVATVAGTSTAGKALVTIIYAKPSKQSVTYP